MRNTYFPFIIPIINPKNHKVNDYAKIEACLEKTLESLSNQTDRFTKVIVVCHRIPTWAGKYSKNVIFLNVSHIPIFVDPATLKYNKGVHADKGLKYIIGIMFAICHYDPELVMLMDGDDYINIHLVEHLRILPFLFPNQYKNNNAFFIQKGVHVKLEVSDCNEVSYIEGYLINGFAGTCGSSRIYKTDALLDKLIHSDKNILERYNNWPDFEGNNYLNVPIEPITYLHNLVKETYFNIDNVVAMMGRHVLQRDYYNIFNLPIIGAAKGCGHGNHFGERGNNVTESKIFSSYPIESFYNNFGICANNNLE